jgi:RNA polymerase sigma factor (TIGR02999 family)
VAEEPAKDITRLLRAWSAGDQSALDSLIPLVYDDLHRAAHRYMAREAPDNTLQTTALVNEVYLRLFGGGAQEVDWQNRTHFLAVCATVMRRILVDVARSRRSLKRGGTAEHLPLDDAILVSNAPRVDLLDLDEALRSLAAVDERQARVVELRFFGGLSVNETAEVLHVSPETVHRDWRLAREWLMHELA